MSKRFKLRLSYPSFHFCRLKQLPSLPQPPSPSTSFRFSLANSKSFDISYPTIPNPPPSTPNLPSLKRRLSPKITPLSQALEPVKISKNENTKKRTTTKKESARVNTSSADCSHHDDSCDFGCTVVKRSEDPYVEFKRSMLEMVLERQLFEAEDLEELLLCFLSINSRHHHAAIVQAFVEVWEFLFCESNPKSQRKGGR